MAIIYTYPSKSVIKEQDLFLMTDSEDGNKTKNASFVDIKDSLDVVDTFTSTFGTFISGITQSNETGNVSIGNVDLSATGTPEEYKFLQGNNVWARVDLTQAVTGTLPVASGGTGATNFSPAGFVKADGTNPFTSAQYVDMTSEVEGILKIANGGTDASTANDAINNLLPDQSGQSGKVLISDGTDTSWASVTGTGTVTEVTSTDTNLLTVATPTTTPALTVVTAPMTPTGTNLATSAQIATYIQSRGFLTTNQTITLSGDVGGTGATAISTTIGNDRVKYNMLNTDVIDDFTALTPSTGLEQLLVSTKTVQGQPATLNKMNISTVRGSISAVSPITSATTSAGATTIELGNVPVTNLNSGTNANKGTFWGGTGSWSVPSGYTAVDWAMPDVSISSFNNNFSGYLFTSSSTFQLTRATIAVESPGSATFKVGIYTSMTGILQASGTSTTPIAAGIVDINILKDDGTKLVLEAGEEYAVFLLSYGTVGTTQIVQGNANFSSIGGTPVAGQTAASNLPVANELPGGLNEIILNTETAKPAITLT